VVHENTLYQLSLRSSLIVPSPQSPSYIQKADVILFIDVIVPWIPSTCTPPRNCKIISMDIDPLRLAQPTWEFSGAFAITCDSSKAIPALSRLVEEFITSQHKVAFVSV